MTKLYYLAHYSDPSKYSNRKTAPAADTKIDYIISSLKKLGYDVEVLSFCVDDDRRKFLERKPGYRIVKNGVPVQYFDNYASSYRLFRVLGRIVSWWKISHFLCKKIKGTDCKIVVYHSLGLLKLNKLLQKIGKDYILEVEEIYEDVIGNARIRRKEIETIKKANGYIFPTKLLDSQLNVENRPAIIIHGTYQVEPERECKNKHETLQQDTTKTIHCVYAGTFDPRKGGAAAAAAAAEFLPFGYHIHILGFGSEEEKKNMQDTIDGIAKKSKAKVTYDGLLTGEDYIRFIQSCDIGLSTQNPDAAFNATSFPSKILSYMANGLRVVSIRIPAIEQSAVGGMLYYYDKQTPEEIAKAILSVNMQDGYDSREIIRKLDKQFQRDLNGLLEK